MVKIRLAKQGSKGNIFYRIVAVDEKRKLTAIALDVLGYWHPATSKKVIDKEKLKMWLQKGAVVSPAVKKLAGIDQK